MIRYKSLALITRFYPFLSGCGTFANSILIKRLTGNLSRNDWACLHNKLQVFVPLDDYIGRAIYFTGDLDRKISTAINRIVRLGDTAVDIGANLGLVTLQLTKLVGYQGKVIAFEPNPNMVDCLKKSLQRNQINNVTLMPFGLGDQDGSLELNLPSDGNLGRATMTQQLNHESSNSIKVAVKKLDTVMADIRINKVRLLKIDVEGFESQVFEGGNIWFAAHSPDYVLLESNGNQNETDFDPAMQFLEKLNYKIYAIEKTLLRLTTYHCNADFSSHQNANDFIAVHPRCNQEYCNSFFVRTRP